jgi:hypothetical protein
MDPKIGVISVASPCKASWEQMAGDPNVRFCGACSKNVYSLDNLTTEEVRQLIVEKEGKLCWRFFVRRDGTVLTKDCPVGIKRVRQRMFAAIATACALVASSAAVVLRSGGFWGSSQSLGAWSERVKEQVQPTVPIRAEPIQPMMGQAVVSPEPEQFMMGDMLVDDAPKR